MDGLAWLVGLWMDGWMGELAFAEPSIIFFFQPSIYDVVPLPNKQNLFCAPQAPKDSEVIKYLDLDLEDGSVPEKSAAAGKSFETLGNATGVHYKEIDWCKTNALTETRREVENTRRTGERTLGD